MTMPAAPEALAAAVKDWFAKHGLEIHEADYQFDHDFYGWRHVGERRSFTLWISRITQEDYDPATIVYILRELEPHALMDKLRDVHAHVASNDTEFGVYVRSVFSPSAG